MGLAEERVVGPEEVSAGGGVGLFNLHGNETSYLSAPTCRSDHANL